MENKHLQRQKMNLPVLICVFTSVETCQLIIYFISMCVCVCYTHWQYRLVLILMEADQVNKLHLLTGSSLVSMAITKSSAEGF